MTSAALALSTLHCLVWAWLIYKRRVQVDRFPFLRVGICVLIGLTVFSWAARFLSPETYYRIHWVETAVNDIFVALILLGILRILRFRGLFALALSGSFAGFIILQISQSLSLPRSVAIGRLVFLSSLVVASVVATLIRRRSNDHSLLTVLIGFSVVVFGQLVSWTGVYTIGFSGFALYTATGLLSLAGWVVVSKGLRAVHPLSRVWPVHPSLVLRHNPQSFEGYVELRRSLLNWVLENRAGLAVVYLVVQTGVAIKQVVLPSKRDLDMLANLALRVAR